MLIKIYEDGLCTIIGGIESVTVNHKRQETVNETPARKYKIIETKQGDDYISYHVHEFAYVCNDDGKTIEKVTV